MFEVDIEKDDEVDMIDSCPNCYSKGRKRGIVMGAVAVLIVMVIAHFVANGVMYWKWVVIVTATVELMK